MAATFFIQISNCDIFGALTDVFAPWMEINQPEKSILIIHTRKY